MDILFILQHKKKTFTENICFAQSLPERKADKVIGISGCGVGGGIEYG